jgi:hypothetical protein
MKAPLWVYILAQFLLGFGTAAATAETPKDWVVAFCTTAGAAIFTTLAKLDSSGPGGPPAGGALRAGVVGIVLGAVLFLGGCAVLPPVKGEVCYTNKDGDRVCVGSDGKAIVVTGEIKARVL